MAFKTGFNRPYIVGVYLTKDEDFIWDVKVFHENTQEPSYLLAKEFRTNEVVGPQLIDDMDFHKEIEKVLEEKSKLIKRNH